MHIGLVVRCDVDYGLDLASLLSETGVAVTLYVSHRHAALYMGTPDRLSERVQELGLLPRACRVRMFRLPRLRDPRSLAMARRLCHTMRDDGVDVAHILMGPGELWLGALSCLLHDMPVTSTMMTPRPNVGEHTPASVVWAGHKLLAYGSDLVIVNGADHVALVQRLYGVPVRQIAHVPLGVRTTAVKWSSQRRPEEPGTILFFGKARPHKGLEYLVQAQPIITRQVPHARILISSRGEDLERCRQMIQDNSRFEIHEGFVPGDALGTFFQRASLVALPYISASTSGILMTAYAFGKPVVVTSVGSLPEYVEDGVTGLLVPPYDVEQLAGAIVRLLSDDALRHCMGENATHWVNEQRKSIATRTRLAYQRAIGVHQNAPD